MSPTRILVINPNSNESVTEGIDRAVEEMRQPGRTEIDCVTLSAGPFGIESDADIDAVSPLVASLVASKSDDYDAFIIACYSDPGLEESRHRTAKPVFGIHESAVGLSASYGRRFGVLALGRKSILRHIAYVRDLGLQSFHAGERPLNVTVDQAANDPGTLDKIIATGRELIEEDGAETVILGCAGMATHRRGAQAALGIPVIDPVQAAVTMVIQNS